MELIDGGQKLREISLNEKWEVFKKVRVPVCYFIWFHYIPVEKDIRTALTYLPESPGKLASRMPRITPKGLAMQTAVMAMAAATREPRRLLSDDSAVVAVTAAVLQPNLMTETDTATVKMEACRAMAMKTVRAALSLS